MLGKVCAGTLWDRGFLHVFFIFMARQVVFLSKHPFAEATLEWFLTFVNSHMPREVCALRKDHWAELALERLLTRVDAYVYHQFVS